MDSKGKSSVTPVRAIVVAFLVIGGCLTGWAALTNGFSYCLINRQATKEFLQSRPGDYDSIEFVTRGVKEGMTIQEVDRIMSDAYEVTPLMKIVEPPSGELYKMYFFRYGPPWEEPFGNDKRYLYKEWFRVYFDQARRAYKLRRVALASAGTEYNFTVQVSLADGKMERWSDFPESSFNWGGR